MSGAAHPSAFAAYEIGLARMVSLANAILPDDIPHGAHPHARGNRARSRSRLLRRGAQRRLLRHPRRHRPGLARQGLPPQLPALRRGDRRSRRPAADLPVAPAPGRPRPRPHHTPPRRRPGSHRGRLAGPRPISEDNPIRSARVDVGVFAGNGVHDSAPAILGILFPAHETRRYEPGPDGAMRIAAIDYADPAKAGLYVDPMLMARSDWRDDYRYDAEGRPLGWTRTRPGRSPEVFRADGARAFGGTTEAVAYPLARAADGRLLVEERSAAPALIGKLSRPRMRHGPSSEAGRFVQARQGLRRPRGPHRCGPVPLPGRGLAAARQVSAASAHAPFSLS